MYKTNAAIKTAVETIVEDVHSMANGLLSEWTWRGQVQLYDMMMEKPFTDPTSWVGAYKTIIDEKWKFVIDGFANCPAVEITNDYKGGYVYFKKKLGYLGLEDGFVTHFFLETMGVKATTYNWGWRGANPADMYPGLNTYDFIRLHLYRDISVYEEIGRRAKIMCGGGKVADHMLTMEEWKAAHTVTANSRRRKLLSTEETHSDTQRRLSETVPRLTAAQVQYHVKNHQEAIGINNNIEKYCAPNGYTTSCMMKYSSSKYIETKDTPMML
jgi:putative hemolysin